MSDSRKPKNFRDTEIGSFFDKLSNKIKNITNRNKQTPKHDATNAKKSGIGDILESYMLKIIDFFKTIIQKIRDNATVRRVIAAVAGFFVALYSKAKKLFSAETFEKIKLSVKNFFAKLSNKIRAFIAKKDKPSEQTDVEAQKRYTRTGSTQRKSGSKWHSFKMLCISAFASVAFFFRNLIKKIKAAFAKTEQLPEDKAENVDVDTHNYSRIKKTATNDENKFQEGDKKSKFVVVMMAVLSAVVLFFKKTALLLKKAVSKLKKPVEEKTEEALSENSEKSVNETPKTEIKTDFNEELFNQTDDVPDEPDFVENQFPVIPDIDDLELPDEIPDIDENKNESEKKTEASSRMIPVPDINRLQAKPRPTSKDTGKPSLIEDEEEEDKYSIWVRDRRPFFMVSIGVAVCRLCLLLVVLAGFVCLGIGLGVARAYIASAPELSVEKIENNDQTSYIYDANGDLIIEYYNLENRSWATYDEIPTMLKYAIVASEDENFFEHSGFNFKRIMASVLSNLSGGSVSGGSTITQQVLKLTLLTSQQTYKRKIQEIYLAYQLEKEYSKEDILEWYMNIMPMGGLLYGVKSATEDYFGKELDELTLRECAVLAGCTNAPTYYSPRFCMLSEEDGGFGEQGRLRLYKRANYVLTQMYAVGFITEEEYNEALFDTTDMVTDQIEVKPTSSNYTYEHKYYVEYVLDELVDRLMEANDWEGKTGRQQAYSLLRSGGFKIYTALDIETQIAVENAVYTYKNWPQLADPSTSVSAGGIEQPQCATVVIDNSTGYIAAIVGGRTEPTIRMGLNRAYQSVLAFGSAIKPLSVFGPACDQKLLGNMIIENIPVPINGWQSNTGFPKNFDRTYLGPTTISYSLVKSLNVPTARVLLDRLSPQTSYNYLRALGISESVLELSPSVLALGSTGSYLTEFVAAYATLANNGVYREPLSITQIIDKEGNEVFSSDSQVHKQVFKPSTAFIITQWLHRAASKPESAVQVDLPVNTGIEVAGKTGTNENVRGIAYMGYTKYYTCGVWLGHDDFTPPFTPNTTALYQASPFWKAIMNSIHGGLDSTKIYDEVPDDVIKVTVCAVSGMLPNGDVCEHDQHGYGLTTEYFIKGTEPTEVCNMHMQVEYCTETGMLAGEYCPDYDREYRTVVILPEKSEYLKLIGTEYEEELYKYFPTYYVNGIPYMKDIWSVDDETDVDVDEDGNIIKHIKVLSGEECYCQLHTEESSVLIAQKSEMMDKADVLIRNINKNLRLSKYSTNMSSVQLEQIQIAIDLLREKVSAPIFSTSSSVELFNYEVAQEAYNALESISNTIFDTIDTKLDFKSDYTILGNRLIGQINIKLLSSDYASVITVDELIAINNDIAAFQTALGAPIYSEQEDVETFDEETVIALYDALQINSDALFALLDERLTEEPEEPEEPDDDIISVFTDENTITLDEELASRFAVLIDASTGRIIAEKNSDMTMYPASMTKVMAAIVAYEFMLDNGIDINNTYIELTSDIIAYIEEMNASTAGFVEGEIVSINDLFYGTLVQSGADAVIMLARYCAGSDLAFVGMMNSKAAALGLTGTHFVNCTGLHDADHYSTANDMAVILAYANNYDFLKEAMETDTYTYSQTNKHAMRSVKNTLYTRRTAYDSILENSAVTGATEFGGKTGHTIEAHYCLMTFAIDSNGCKYIVVTADSVGQNGTISDYLYLYNNYADMCIVVAA